MALKRNTPRVLQGLLAGVHIVTKGYLEAVKSATTVQNTDPNNYRASKLEEDFDTWWPKEKDYIPPMGTEPVPRPEQMLEPDPGRSDVFSGFSFIFLTEDQYTSLQEVVNSGGGKALLFDLRFGETTVEEYVEYVRSVAGQKRRSKSSNGFLPVITIRVTNYPEGSEDWCTDFHMGVDQALQQRSLQQNAFLDAILIKDVTSMQMRPTELEPMSSLPEAGNEEPASQSRGPATRPRSLSVAPEPKQEPEKAIPRKRPMRRAITQSRFTGFDDYEPPPKVRKIEEDTIMEDVKPTQPSQNAYVESQPPVPPTQASRRYESQHSVRETVEEVEEQEELFPAAAAIKKRRAATRGLSEAAESGPAPVPVHTKTKGEKVLEQLQRAKRKVGKDIDVREQTRLQLQEAEERRKADEASLREALEGVDINDIRGLVQVEDMEVRAPRQRQNAGGRNRAGDEGWNPDWNGRKNFKKFRRRGAERGPLPQKVIVALLEVPQKKGFGLGEPFFLEETAEKSRERGEERPERREREREKPKTAGARKAWSQDVDVDVDGESSPEQGFTRRKRGQNQNHNREVINVEDSEIDEEDTFPDSVGTLSGRTQRVAETQPEATLETEKSQSQTLRKRARVSVAGQPPNKRSRTARLEEDSDAEEGGFRLRRRR